MCGSGRARGTPEEGGGADACAVGSSGGGEGGGGADGEGSEARRRRFVCSESSDDGRGHAGCGSSSGSGIGNGNGVERARNGKGHEDDADDGDGDDFSVSYALHYPNELADPALEEEDLTVGKHVDPSLFVAEPCCGVEGLEICDRASGRWAIAWAGKGRRLTLLAGGIHADYDIRLFSRLGCHYSASHASNWTSQGL